MVVYWLFVKLKTFSTLTTLKWRFKLTTVYNTVLKLQEATKIRLVWFKPFCFIFLNSSFFKQFLYKSYWIFFYNFFNFFIICHKILSTLINFIKVLYICFIVDSFQVFISFFKFDLKTFNLSSVLLLFSRLFI